MQDDSKTTRKGINRAEKAVDRAFSTGKADRARITRMAQLDAAEAVARAGEAMESDAAADEAARLTVIATSMGNREKAKAARENERNARNQAKIDHRAATRSARQAYEAIKFSDPSKLGFMRVVQVVFLAHIVLTILALILTSRDTVSYSSANLIDWIMAVLESIAFYFFVNRYKVGRPMVIGMSIFGIVATLISDIVNQSFTPFGSFVLYGYYAFLLFYFLFSRRVKVTLVNDLSHDKAAHDEKDFVIDRRSWPFYRNLIIYFVVFSVLGHWMEAGFCQLIRLGIVAGEFHEENTMLWRDWFYPYPMHGTAVILIAVLLYPLFIWLKKKFSNRFAPYVISFLVNMLICTLIEFVGGLMFNANLQNWDYSNMPFNFMGQICLQNAIGFGVASSVIAWWVYPMMEQMIARVRPAIMNIVCVIVAIAGAILFSLYAISPPDGIDLGAVEKKQAEEKTALQNELDELSEEERLMEGINNRMKTTLDESTSIPEAKRQEFKQHSDTITNELNTLKDKISQESALAQNK